jgi:hypothetical protein
MLKTKYTGPVTTYTVIQADASNVLTSTCTGAQYDCSSCAYGVDLYPSTIQDQGQSFGINWAMGDFVDLTAGCWMGMTPTPGGVPTFAPSESKTQWTFDFSISNSTPFIYARTGDVYAFLCMNLEGPYLDIQKDPRAYSNPDALWWLVSAGHPPTQPATFYPANARSAPITKKAEKKLKTEERHDDWMIWGATVVGLLFISAALMK